MPEEAAAGSRCSHLVCPAPSYNPTEREREGGRGSHTACALGLMHAERARPFKVGFHWCASCLDVGGLCPKTCVPPHTKMRPSYAGSRAQPSAFAPSYPARGRGRVGSGSCRHLQRAFLAWQAGVSPHFALCYGAVRMQQSVVQRACVTCKQSCAVTPRRAKAMQGQQQQAVCAS